MWYMVMVLKLWSFTDNICLRLPATMHEIRLRVADYKRMEEMTTLQTKFCTNLQLVERRAEKALAKADPRP